MLADQEAEALAKALIEIERLYPTQIDPRVFAWVNLVGVAGMIYGTRVFAIQARLSSEREAKRRETQGGDIVTHLHSVSTAATFTPPGEPMPPMTDIFHTSKN